MMLAMRSSGEETLASAPRHGHGRLDGQNRQQLLAMSAATIDRILKGVRASATGQRRRKGSTAIRRSVPVRTFSDWNNPVPGFVEAEYRTPEPLRRRRKACS